MGSGGQVESNDSTTPGQSMEIDQITSLVSIFSFGQQIMAAANAAANNSPVSTSMTPDNLVRTADSPELEEKLSPKDKVDSGGGGGGKDNEEKDSDSESDTSSDSGHSSDDHDNSDDNKKEEEDLDDSGVVITKLSPVVPTTTSATEQVVSSQAAKCIKVSSL